MAVTYTIKYDKIECSIIIPVLIEHNNHSVLCSALIDTGATVTAISEWIINDLHLPVVNDKISRLITADSRSIRPVVKGNVYISSDLIFKDLELTSIKDSSSDYDLIVGTDILFQTDFSISNFNNHTIFTLRYPSQGEIKYGDVVNHKTDIDNIASRIEDILLST